MYILLPYASMTVTYIKFVCSLGHAVGVHLCGDNWDKGRKQRHMRVGIEKIESLHYCHSYAVSDRIDFSNLSPQVHPTLQTSSEQIALSLLPNTDDDSEIRDNICTLLSRVLYNNMSFVRLSFDGVVDWHIKHEFYKEMSAKSDIVSVRF